MPWFDLPLADLRTYHTATEEPPGLDEWWRSRLDEARSLAKPPTVTRYEAAGYGPAEVYDVAFSGARGDRIRAWYIRPRPAGPAAAAPWWSSSSATAAAAACPPITCCCPPSATRCS